MSCLWTKFSNTQIRQIWLNLGVNWPLRYQGVRSRLWCQGLRERSFDFDDYDKWWRFISNKKWFFRSKAPPPNPILSLWDNLLIFVWNGLKCSDGPKRIPNCQKHLGFLSRTFLDHFGPLWNVDKPAMFGHFCLFCFINAFFFGTACTKIVNYLSKYISQ